jgi:hypothetical protein
VLRHPGADEEPRGDVLEERGVEVRRGGRVEILREELVERLALAAVLVLLDHAEEVVELDRGHERLVGAAAEGLHGVLYGKILVVKCCAGRYCEREGARRPPASGWKATLYPRALGETMGAARRVKASLARHLDKARCSRQRRSQTGADSRC